MEGTAFSIEEAGFDASLLPEGSRTPGTEAFHRAVSDYFQKSYASMGGQLSVVFAAGRIEVAWEPTAPEAPAMASIGPLLQQRRFSEARPLLETLLQLEPEHPEALYNLGVLASEEGKLEEARLLLRRAVVANAGDAHAQANAQVALALAAMRLGDKAEARQALESAIELEPQNSFALRSLGSLLVIAGAFAAGVARFRQALAVALRHFAEATHGRLVAEGVESSEQIERLRAIGCTEAQGHFLGAPEPAMQLEAKLVNDLGAGWGGIRRSDAS